MPYIKLKNNVEYSVSEDGKYLLSKHDPSGQNFWGNARLIPSGKLVKEFRESKSGANVEVLLDDNRWYKIDSNGHTLILTTEEMEKDRMILNAEKKARKAKKGVASKTTDENEDDDEKDNDVYHYNYDHSSYRSRSSESEDDGMCTKLVFTILPILPLWWIIKIPFSIVTWPFRCIFSSKNKSLLPSYSFKKF